MNPRPCIDSAPTFTLVRLPRLVRTGCVLGAMLACLLAGTPANAAEPVSVTAIDLRTGIVAARDALNKRTVKFRVTDAALLRSLRVGQKVTADMETRKVSVNGAAPCCAIISVDKAEPAGASGRR